MILAGDIGGTNTRLALFGRDARAPLELATYPTRSGQSLTDLIRRFVTRNAPVDTACFGVAATIAAGRANGVNLPWTVDERELSEHLDAPVKLVNDLHANARGVEALAPGDFAELNPHAVEVVGNRAVVSAGTGLGEAGLLWDGTRYHGVATEGGHADFAPRSELQVELYRFLAAELGHVSYERICSGAGLVNIYRFLSRGRSRTPDAATISATALADRTSVSSRALDLFVSIYGARAGNVALGFLATGGVYLGGGIPPKIVDRLREGIFMRAFVDKGRFSPLLERIPVRVILNDRAALLGAARIAAEHSTVHPAHP